ncbi:hypothetical protein SO802_004320 [Lithocarpus litseifolius]|uniref:RNase H type-1 domain-containing protein n=1 Tax=Lithocarpus litseifolius TaxID=425828 RepID=A0AAW2E7X1_9ROSI
MAENLCKSVGQVIHSYDRFETVCGDFMRVRVEIDVHKPLCRGRKKKVVRVCGIGAPAAASSRGPDLSSETLVMNTVVELPSRANVQLGKQRPSETSLEGEHGMGTSLPLDGAISDILRDEDAFQNHLKEIDMELEGYMHPTKGIHESFSLEVGKADGQEIGVIMVQESTLAETNSKIMDVAVEAEVDLPKIVTHMNKEEGSHFSPKGCEEQDKQRQESPSVGLGQPSSELDNATSVGPNTRTWKRLQHQPMHVGTVVAKDVEVGTKRKHKPEICISEPTENPEVKKRREDDEVLEMRSLLQASRFGECNFFIVPRSGNRVAHGLAQYAKNLSDSCTWMVICPLS